ncbi:MAG: RDD family protein [Propionibacteriaceae bacterium]
MPPITSATESQPQIGKIAIAPIPLRLLAGVIDAFLMHILSGIASIPVLLKYLEPVKKIFEQAMVPGSDQNALTKSLLELISSRDSLVLSGITFLTWFLYAGVLLSWGGATLGQRALGLRVQKTDGKTLDKNLAWLKSLLWGILIITMSIPGLGFLSIWNLLRIMWNPRRQSLVDLVTQTLVVRR